jgi:aspartyl-tRNA(Asn)/glutamyl-tRNA(Gln) amidotransferase subunit B
MYDSGRTAEDLVASEGLSRIDDESAVLEAVRSAIEANPGPASQYRSGKTSIFGFLVGQVMRATGGKANPKLVNELLKRELEQGHQAP